MPVRHKQASETTDRPIRRVFLRVAAVAVVLALARGVPMDGRGSARAGESSPLNPAPTPDFTTLPSGWPGPVPDLNSPLEIEVWSMVYAACERHGILDEAVTMYQVLWEESRLTSRARSVCGRYHGISQFALSTFRHNVHEMRRLGLIWGDEAWSPFEPSQAIEVMAFMWSRGFHDHWGPYRRVARRLGTARVRRD